VALLQLSSEDAAGATDVERIEVFVDAIKELAAVDFDPILWVVSLVDLTISRLNQRAGEVNEVDPGATEEGAAFWSTMAGAFQGYVPPRYGGIWE
jgi:hypothetical protein